jgi:hypothetical protein
MEKLHDGDEVWRYMATGINSINIFYKIDGTYRTFAQSRQYLTDTYKMEMNQAEKYIGEIQKQF